MWPMEKLLEGKDFYYSDSGQKIFTKAYLLKRGHCCKSGCLNCPYESGQQLNPNIPPELNDPWKSNESGEESSEIYEDEIPEDEDL